MLRSRLHQGYTPTHSAAAATVPFAAWFVPLIWVCLYAADLRIILDQPLHLLAMPIAVVVTFRYSHRPPTWVATIGILLLLSLAYQSLVGSSILARPFLEVLMLVYVFSIRQLRSLAGLERAGTALAVFFCASFLLFVATIAIPGASNLRDALYPRTEARSAAVEDRAGDEESVEVHQGGLSYLLHTFGYQLASGSVFLAGLAMFSRSRRFVWCLGLIAAGVALLMSGQRSAVVGFSIGVLGLTTASRGGWKKYAIIGTLAASCWLTLNSVELESFRTYNTALRFQSEADIADRLRLQWWALSQTPNFPIGIAGAGVEYGSIAPVWTIYGPMAPHNGYITRLLWYGWPVGLLTLAVFGVVLAMFHASWQKTARIGGLNMEWIAVWALVSVMTNALFHNASFVTFNPDTLTMLFLYAATVDAARVDPARTVHHSAYATQLARGTA